MLTHCESHGGSDWGVHMCRPVFFQRHTDVAGLTGTSGNQEKSSKVNNRGLGEQEEVAVLIHVKNP